MLKLQKYIAIVSLFILLVPSVIQTIHAFEDHTHIVCSAVDEHHFHEQEVNCSILHFHFEVFSFDHSISFSVIPEHFYKTVFTLQPQFFSHQVVKQQASRAPPCFTV